VLSQPRRIRGDENLPFSPVFCTGACSCCGDDIPTCTTREDSKDEAAIFNPEGIKTLLLATTGVSQSFGAHAPAATPDTSGLCAISRLCSKHSTNGESECLRGKTSCGALTLDGGAWYAAPLSPRGGVSNRLRPRGLALTPVLHIPDSTLELLDLGAGLLVLGADSLPRLAGNHIS